jgi:hypothetical protein
VAGGAARYPLNLKQPPDPEGKPFILHSPLDPPGVFNPVLPVNELGTEPEKGWDEAQDHAFVEDGRAAMFRIFVGRRLVPAAVFNECWLMTRGTDDGKQLGKPFIQSLAERGILDLATSLQLLREHSRANLMPLAQYKIDCGLAVRFSRIVCRRWLILPFDSEGRYTMVATANPLNQHAAFELQESMPTRVVWYLVRPVELVLSILRVFR